MTDSHHAQQLLTKPYGALARISQISAKREGRSLTGGAKREDNTQQKAAALERYGLKLGRPHSKGDTLLT